MLQIKNFSKTYNGGKSYAVDDASFEVKSGEIVAFIGHNGSGKTTTLKAICGILNFEKGEILVDGINVKENAEQVKKIIGYLPETIQMYEFLTGYQFLNFVADVYEVGSEVRKEIITKYATLFKMQDALKQTIDTYSHGMKQKTAIISLLLHSPKLIIMDEPFFGLDPQSTFEFKNLMGELASQGVSLLYSTHVLQVAETLATSVVIINKGKIVKSGKMKDVIADKSLEKFFLEIAHE
ncbi:MAG: ABC transporter ATP-binding protein [Christensenellales bacterium]|jgi:ABC-2 type transport system ATP-binding protein